MANQDPSRNPANESTLAGVVQLAVRKAMQSFDVMMPVEVVSYDRATNRAVVKHSIQMKGSNGENVDRAPVASIRVYQFGNGAFNVSLPIKPGDKGWLMAADRDLSLYQQDLNKTDAPNTQRMHSFQDGLFMPDAMANGDAPAGQGDRVVIGSNGGGTYFAFDDSGFEFTGPFGTLTMDASGIKHNGKNIGDTHTHSGVVPGSGNTGVPNA